MENFFFFFFKSWIKAESGVQHLLSIRLCNAKGFEASVICHMHCSLKHHFLALLFCAFNGDSDQLPSDQDGLEMTVNLKTSVLARMQFCEQIFKVKIPENLHSTSEQSGSLSVTESATDSVLKAY